MTEPAPAQEAAAYIIEMLASMAHFAHVSDLQNTSVMLSAAAKIVEQECRFLTDGGPKFTGEPPSLPHPFVDPSDD